MTLTSTCQETTDTNAVYVPQKNVTVGMMQHLIRDAEMGKVYKAEYLRTDSLLTSYKALKSNYDSAMLIFSERDKAKDAIIGNVVLQNDNLSKQLEFQAAWTKALDKEFHKLKVKNFFQQSGLVAVIGGLVYILVKR
jgi:hypothetical protein